ncbi:CUB domain-containing protein 1 [Dendropsophus ebraccatus]|uniref:CUB domain-containing protein 1 n=1 Tax=Dendropsophus ebraccatus TaxID=150705 RepID=UPI0038313F20
MGQQEDSHKGGQFNTFSGLDYTKRTMLLLGYLLALLLPPLTESVTISLASTDNTVINIKRIDNTSPPCYICAPNCKEMSLEISKGKKVDYTFSCKTPEMYFIMEINRTIDCSLRMCPSNITLHPSNLDGLNRTFFWNILTSKNNGLVLGFSTPLRQIHPSSLCSDLVSFNVSTYVRDSSYNIGTFCRNGTITRIKVQERGVISLSLPWNVTIKDPGISITNRSSIKRLSIVESTFLRESVVSLLSANYPGPFPHNEQMTWKFIFPENHAASVQFLNYTLPVCVKKDEHVLYYLPKSTLLKLTDKQPANILANFNVSLQNCEVDKQMSGHPGLSLNFSVTIQKSQGNTLYPLDLTNEKGLVVRIQKKSYGRTFTPVCVICKGPTDCDSNLVLEGGKYYRISFLCDNLNSLMVTAEKEIECWNLATCNISNMPLTIPRNFVDFPVQLESFTWKLIAPEYISTEIVSTSTYLQQSVSDKPCNSTSTGFAYDILSSTNKNYFKLGTFCPNGSIEKIQMRDNVTIILNVPRNGNPQKLLTHDLCVSFVSFIKEECIFTVSPKTQDAIYLQTPHWDYGLPDYVSVSWGINLPKKQSGRLKFGKDKMDILCEMGRAYVNIKEQIDDGPGIVRREDQQLPGPLDMYSAFWVNISNCKPLTGTKKLQLQLSITFNQVSPVLKIILISVASAVAVVLAVMAAVCCIKRKKKRVETPVGIYNSKVNTEAPRRQAFFKKGRKSNESHIYAVIDDTMVYGHLLQDNNGTDSEVDVYRPFEGPMGDVPPVPPITFPNGSTKDDVKETSIKEDVKIESINGDIIDENLALSMKDNEIYVFSKSISRQPVENEDTSITYMDDSRSGTMSSA